MKKEEIKIDCSLGRLPLNMVSISLKVNAHYWETDSGYYNEILAKARTEARNIFIVKHGADNPILSKIIHIQNVKKEAIK